MDRHDDRTRCSINGHASAIQDSESSTSCLNIQKSIVRSNIKYDILVHNRNMVSMTTCRKRHLEISSEGNWWKPRIARRNLSVPIWIYLGPRCVEHSIWDKSQDLGTRGQPTEETKCQNEHKWKDSPVHIPPTCVGSGEGSNHFESYVCDLSPHFYRRLFLGLTHDLMVTKQQLYSCARAPFPEWT
jgi:hypothetical protein